METPTFLMSPPRRDWRLRGRANFRAREAEEVEPGPARDEWTRLADAIVDCGGDVVVLPPNPRKSLTGMLYTAEAGEYVRDDDGDDKFLLPNMAVEHRRDEADWIGGFFEGLGVETLGIDSVWEAQGDAIRAADPERIVHTFGEGPDARTDPASYEEVADRLSDDHLQIPFRADPWFHGNTFLNVYRRRRADGWEGLALVCPAALDAQTYDRLAAFLEDADILEIDREESLDYATNALQVGDSVLAPTGLSERLVDALENFGLEVLELDFDELFGKGGGAPVCLTNRLWGIDTDALPDRVLWSAHPSVDFHTSY